MQLRFHTRWLSFRLQLPSWPRRFSLVTLLWIVTLAGVLFAWRRDHMAQEAELNKTRGELLRLTKNTAAWGVEQLLGPPDTQGSGDIPSAWASATPDRQAEWIVVDFAQAVQPAAVEVHETYNPGALTQVSIFDPLGREVVVWQGVDPTKPTAGRGVSKIAISTIWKTRKLKLYIDSPTVAGWNEIDAVGLYDAAGAVQWAQNATASSAYGGREAKRGTNASYPYVFTVPLGY